MLTACVAWRRRLPLDATGPHSIWISSALMQSPVHNPSRLFMSFITLTKSSVSSCLASAQDSSMLPVTVPVSHGNGGYSAETIMLLIITQFGSVMTRLIFFKRCSDVMMSAMACQITGVSVVCSTVCSGADQRKHQSSASLAFVGGIHRWPVDSPHEGPVTRKMFPFDDVIMNTCHRPSNNFKFIMCVTMTYKQVETHWCTYLALELLMPDAKAPGHEYLDVWLNIFY